MNNQLKNLDFKSWNKKEEKWVKEEKNIKKGIYLIHFNQNKLIYEVRNIKKNPFNKHIIKKNEIVLKPGKFINGFKNRIFGGSGYAKYWKYENETQGNKRELSDCFENSTSIYLIADLSDYEEDEFIELVEVYTKLILKRIFGVEKQEIRKSEYYRYIDERIKLDGYINSLRGKVDEFVNNNR